jgi:hypothetical protein
MSYKRKRRLKDYSLDYYIRRDYSALKKMYTRKDRTLLDSGFYDTETWSGLRKCWKGYKIAKAEGDTTKMVYYAKGIRKLEGQLGISVMDFPKFGLVGRFVEQERESENETIWGSFEQVEKDLEDYESQMQMQYEHQHQQQHSDYIINQEFDLRKAQLEDIKEIFGIS